MIIFTRLFGATVIMQRQTKTKQEVKSNILKDRGKSTGNVLYAHKKMGRKFIQNSLCSANG